MSKEEQQQHITSIGGQAVMEGVMMRGPFKTAVAVRKPDGDIECKVEENGTKTRKKFWRLPIIRGCVSFVDSLVIGMKALMFSAEFVDIEEDSHLFTSLFEGIIRMVIFIGYLAIVSNMKDIKRVFQYHGAEHKTIACYEAGEELTVENIKKHTRFHPRCGTSFLLFVMIVSILLFALLPRVDMVILRVLMRLALLPAVAGISFEIIKFAGRSKSKWVAWLSKPGLWLQKLTTREPDASQIEVAIESMKPCIPENKEDDRW